MLNGFIDNIEGLFFWLKVMYLHFFIFQNLILFEIISQHC